MLPWPSTTIAFGRVSSYARTISASSSPTMKSALIESSGTPYVEPCDDIQSVLDRFSERRPELLRDVSAEGRHPDDQRLWLEGPDRLVHVRDDRDAVWRPIEDLPRIAPGLGVIDDADDLIPLRVSHEPVRRLPRALSKISVAQDDGALHTNPL